MRLGIGVPTFNRAGLLADTLAAIARYTTKPHHLVVADDGSTDGTPAFLRRTRTPHIRGANRGIAWNKNRLLYCLREILRCDVIILIEDDTAPCLRGWEDAWIEAAERLGHANLAVPGLGPFVSGRGSPVAPYISEMVGGQCAVFSRAAINAAGYMDTRFGRYGNEHTEHSHRLIHAGYGGLLNPTRFFLIEGGVAVSDSLSSATEADLEAATRLLHEVVGLDPEIYRHPWRSPEERLVLQSEARGGRYLAGGRINAAWRIARTNLRAWRLRLEQPDIYLPGHQLNPFVAAWFNRRDRSC